MIGGSRQGGGFGDDGHEEIEDLKFEIGDTCRIYVILLLPRRREVTV
jgi:hypothetical protein